MDFGKILLKAINQNYWVRIEYKNKSNEITKFMIGINFVDSKNKGFKCDAFNLSYNHDVQEDYYIHFDNILEAEVLEDTYHQTPETLLNYIAEHPETISFLKPGVSRDELIDYYIDCFKMDTVPYVGKYGLIPGIDNDNILENNRFQLNDEQFELLAKDAFYKKERKKKKQELGIEKIENKLVINELGIKTNKGSVISII